MLQTSAVTTDRTVVTATRLVNEKRRFLDPQRSKFDIKLDKGDYVEDITPHAHFGISILKGGRAACA